MITTLLIQIILILTGLYFIYIGVRTLFSKKYFIEKRNRNNPKEKDRKYENLSISLIVYERYGWGGQWLFLGLGLLVLVIYSFFKL